MFDEKAIRASFRGEDNHSWPIGALQVAIYTAAGGGWIGSMYAQQPADAYVDMRLGRLPYGKRDLEKMRRTLVIMAEEYGLDPHNLPPRPVFHNCLVF